MANNTDQNPNVIDTFSADVNIGGTKGTPAIVSSIVMEGASAGDTATFIDEDGTEVLRLSNTVAGGSVVWTPAEPFIFQKGLTFDDSASSLDTNDFIFIFLA